MEKAKHRSASTDQLMRIVYAVYSRKLYAMFYKLTHICILNKKYLYLYDFCKYIFTANKYTTTVNNQETQSNLMNKNVYG